MRLLGTQRQDAIIVEQSRDTGKKKKRQKQWTDGYKYPRVLDIVGEFHIIRTIYTSGTLCACFAHSQRNMLVKMQGTAVMKKPGEKGGMK